jgi:SUN domain-containing protein 1/2
MEFLRKDEFDAFLTEIKETLGSDSGSQVDLDQVRALVREIVMREIEKHAADGIARVDYALGSAGGRVTRYSEPYDAGKRAAGLLSAFPFGAGGSAGDQSQKMIQPSFGEPGQCFPLKGSSGFVEIHLRKGIIPDAITLEHVSKVILSLDNPHNSTLLTTLCMLLLLFGAMLFSVITCPYQVME